MQKNEFKKTNKHHTSHFTLRTSQNGITLIALIITIIVMLILVGVTINVALNGGLFTKASEASKQMQVEAEKEELLSSVVAAIGYDGKVVLEDLELPTGWSGSNGTYTSPKGNTFSVDENGKITGGNEQEEISIYGTYLFYYYDFEEEDEVAILELKEPDENGNLFAKINNSLLEYPYTYNSNTGIIAIDANGEVQEGKIENIFDSNGELINSCLIVEDPSGNTIFTKNGGRGITPLTGKQYIYNEGVYGEKIIYFDSVEYKNVQFGIVDEEATYAVINQKLYIMSSPDIGEITSDYRSILHSGKEYFLIEE